MKPQEAIETMKIAIAEVEWNYPMGYAVAFENAISALEKQIPKKPDILGYREGREINTISYTCPNCNKHIGRENHCKHCGQALLWESEVQGE